MYFRHSWQAGVVAAWWGSIKKRGQRSRHGYISYLLLHNKSPQSLVTYSNQHLLSNMISESQECGNTWVALHWDLPGGCSQPSAGTALIWKLDWELGIHLQDGSLTWLLSVASVLLWLFTICFRSLSYLLLHWAAWVSSDNFSQSKQSKREQDRNSNVFHDLALEVTLLRLVIDRGDHLGWENIYRGEGKLSGSQLRNLRRCPSVK